MLLITFYNILYPKPYSIRTVKIINCSNFSFCIFLLAHGLTCCVIFIPFQSYKMICEPALCNQFVASKLNQNIL